MFFSFLLYVFLIVSRYIYVKIVESGLSFFLFSFSFFIFFFKLFFIFLFLKLKIRVSDNITESHISHIKHGDSHKSQVT